MARHWGVVSLLSKVVLTAALALWLLFAATADPIAQIFWEEPQGPTGCGGPICGLDATYFIVSGVGNESAYLGGDGISCCGGPAPDVEFGSLNPAVTWVSLYNPGGRFQMNLVANRGWFVSDLLVQGVKQFVQTHPIDPSKQIVYVSLEGPEAGTYIRGTAELINGEAAIALPEHFSMVTSEAGLTVQLTPVGEWLQLYVVEKSTTRLLIREAQGKSGRFDYLVQGVRKGYESYQAIQKKVW